MNKPIARTDVEADGQSGGVSTKLSAGCLLRTAREAAGVDISALAAVLKVPVAKLVALESDRLDLLQDVAFARALTATVCRTLKIEPAPILAQLPSLHVAQPQVTAPFKRKILEPPYEKSGLLSWSNLVRPLPFAIFCLLLAILILILLPYIQNLKLLQSPAMEVSSSAASALEFDGASAAVARSAHLSVDGLNVLSLPAGVVGGGNSPESSQALTQNVNSQFSAAPTNTASLPSNVMQTPAAVAAKDVLVLSTSASSWVQVSDDTGAIIINTTLEPGAPVSVKRTIPLAVVVGRADVIQVWVRGQSFDIAPFTKKNVARFEVR